LTSSVTIRFSRMAVLHAVLVRQCFLSYETRQFIWNS